jgi:hypothetical protein
MQPIWIENKKAIGDNINDEIWYSAPHYNNLRKTSLFIVYRQLFAISDKQYGSFKGFIRR